VPARLAILAAAFALVVLPAAPRAEPAKPDVPDVTFVAWNVRNYMLSPVKNGDGRITTPAKTAASAQAVSETLASLQPDIVGLCEIGTREDLEDLQRRLEQSGAHLPYRTWVDGADRERHLALLSKFPLREVRHDTKSKFDVGRLPQPVRRGFLDCTAEIQPGFRLRILGAHFKSRRIVPEFDQAEVRRNESLLLGTKIDGILQAEPGALLLLFGDLNDNKNAPAIAGLAARRGGASLSILELADRVGDQWTYHWAESDEYGRVDYVMASKALLPLLRKKTSTVHRAARWDEASDHRPLVVKIRRPAAGKNR